MVTRNRSIAGSWDSVHASCETKSSRSGVAGIASSTSLVRSTRARPLEVTGTETTERRPGGRKLSSVSDSSGAGPWSRSFTRVEANCGPSGTNTGSGTSMVPEGSKK